MSMLYQRRSRFMPADFKERQRKQRLVGQARANEPVQWTGKRSGKPSSEMASQCPKCTSTVVGFSNEVRFQVVCKNCHHEGGIRTSAAFAIMAWNAPYYRTVTKGRRKPPPTNKKRLSKILAAPKKEVETIVVPRESRGDDDSAANRIRESLKRTGNL